jgi:predicted cupin superfamily sugar epimerase
MDARARQIVDALGLRAHPEGGFYRETFRSALQVPAGQASTAIYFLLPAGTFSAFHVIQGSDEVWHHYEGDPVELHTFAPNGDYAVEMLGPDIAGGQRPQLVVPAGTLQAAVPRGDRFALCGCTVAPGFEFANFTMPSRDELLARFPHHEPTIRRLTRA